MTMNELRFKPEMIATAVDTRRPAAAGLIGCNVKPHSQNDLTYFDEHRGGEGVVGGYAEPVDAGRRGQVTVGREEGHDCSADAAEHHAHRVDRVEVSPGAVAHPPYDELAHGVEDPDEGDEKGGVGELEAQVALGVVHQVNVPDR